MRYVIQKECDAPGCRRLVGGSAGGREFGRDVYVRAGGRPLIVRRLCSRCMTKQDLPRGYRLKMTKVRPETDPGKAPLPVPPPPPKELARLIRGVPAQASIAAMKALQDMAVEPATLRSRWMNGLKNLVKRFRGKRGRS